MSAVKLTAGLLLAVLLLGRAALGDRARAADPVRPSAAGIGSLSGAEIYHRICQGCHMPDGQGAVGAGRYPKLVGDAALASWQYVALTVIGGRSGMPAFGMAPSHVPELGGLGLTVDLSDAQIAAVVNFVRRTFGHFAGAVTAAQVAALPHAPRE